MTTSLKILLIEDDEDDFVMARELLAEAFADGCDLEWISDPKLGQERIGNNAHDVYLIDYSLGEIDGLELVRHAIDRGCEAPIILLTGMNVHEIDVQAMRAGAADYLFKGEISPGLLERSIRYGLARQKFLGAQLQAKELLRQKNQRLSQLYKTAHQFVDNVSHEFRTPLTVIKEFASILAEGLAGDVNDEQREFLDIILSRVDDLSLMVNDMLDISKLEAGLFGVLRKEWRFEKIIEQIRTTLERKAAASGSTLTMEIDDALPSIYCDAEKIGRVIVNLAVNAFKFSGEGGKVQVWARHSPVQSQIAVGVTDNGPGIDAENIQAIFERFKQVGGDLRASTKGFGLGLSIVKELVHANLGEIEVKSKLGHGSTFAFTVPTFDPPKILERFTKRIDCFREGSSDVSLIAASLDPDSDPALQASVERFLQRQIRSCDLLFGVRPDTWLLCATDERARLDPMIARIEKARAEANRNCLNEVLPEIRFEIVGTWSVKDQRSQLIRRFEAEYGAPKTRGVNRGDDMVERAASNAGAAVS